MRRKYSFKSKAVTKEFWTVHIVYVIGSNKLYNLLHTIYFEIIIYIGYLGLNTSYNNILHIS